jgi:hypothetical protein
MTIKYTKKINELGQEFIEMISENGTISFVPIEPANSDYQRYLNPEAEQSTPSVTNGD